MRMKVSKIGDWGELQKRFGRLSAEYQEVVEAIRDRLAKKFVSSLMKNYKGKSIVTKEDEEEFQGIANRTFLGAIRIVPRADGSVFAGIDRDFEIEGKSVIEFLKNKEFGVNGTNAVGIWRKSYRELKASVQKIANEEFSKLT